MVNVRASSYFSRGQARTVEYESSSHVNIKVVEREDDLAHSGMLRFQYAEAIDTFTRISEQLPEEVRPVEGSYLNVVVVKRANTLDKFDSKTGAGLMNVRVAADEGDEQLTIFLSDANKNWLSKKLKQYEKEPGENANRANVFLVNSISNISSAELKSFFIDETEYAAVTDVAAEYEIWIANELYEESNVKIAFDAIGVTVCNRNLVFQDIVVYMIVATKEQLNMVIHSVKGVSEIRIHRRPTVLSNTSDLSEQNEWLDLIQSDRFVSGNLCRIGILDSGVTNTHPLIKDFLPDSRCYSVTVTENKRDLTEALYGNDPEMYAVITEDAIATCRKDGVKLLCSAVTSAHQSKEGIPSSTSAAIDQTLYNNGACDTLMLISAGNIHNTDGVSYPDYLFNNPVFDPSQSWNAITVGAFTDKVCISDPLYHDAQVIAPAGGVSPFSTSSMRWGKQSLIKPEILMEGGNAVLINNDLDAVDDLSLVCADSNPLIKKFTTINATSAATAMAARLVGRIKNANPELSPLSIRALLVHSAEWTDKMKELFTEAGKLNKSALIHTCGYGVPVEKKAIASSDSYVTFIAEDVIEPFIMSSDGKSLKFGYMNLYELPWPKEILSQMGGTIVTMKITLSYYICPSPGSRSMLNKYTYQSLRLNFDVNGATEDLQAFENRIKRVKEEGEVRESGLSSRWTIGIQTRNQGSVVSDKIENITAAQLASCNMIAVYPSGGWFKKNIDNEHLKIKYSLVVSLETPEQNIYETIANQVGITLPISTL